VRSGGANAQDQFTATGALAALTEGANLVLSGTTIGTVTTNSNGTLVLTFGNNATVSQFNLAMRAIAYGNSSDAPPASVTLSWTINDGNTGAQGSGGAASISQDQVVNITASNDAPALVFGEAGKTFTEGGAAVMVDALAVVSDADSVNFDGGVLTVAVSANASADDRVELLNTGMGAGEIGISGMDVFYGGVQIGTAAGGIGAVPFTVTFNANADAAAVQEVIRNVRFWVAGDDPSVATRTLQVQLSDGDGGISVAQSKQIAVDAVDEAPTATGGTIVGSEDTTHVFTWAEFGVSDVDSGIGSATAIQITALPADGVLQCSNGFSWEPVTLGQTLTKASIDAGWLRFVPDANEWGDDSAALGGVGEGLTDYAVIRFVPVQTIAILNPDAELGITHAEGTGDTLGGAWSVTGSVYVSNLTSAYYPGDHDQAFGLGSGASMAQSLGTGFSSDLDYELSADIGWNSAWSSPMFRLELWAGGTRLGFADETAITPVQGDFVRVSLAVDGSGFAALDGQALEVRIVEASGWNALNVDNILLTTTPGGVGTEGEITVDLAPVNDAPVVGYAGLPGAVSFTEQSPVAIAALFTVTDIDSGTLTGATIAFTGGYESGVDELAFSDMLGIVGSWDAGTATLTLTGTASVADYQTAIRSIAFYNGSDAPSTSQRSIDIVVTDGAATSNVLTRTVDVAQSNDAPVLTGSGGSVQYNENFAPVTLDGALSVSDVDSATLTGARVSISAAFSSGEDSLAFTDQLGITGSWDGATGILTLSGTASVADYETALRSVTYVNTNDDPSVAVRTVEFVVNDGALDSAAVTRQVQVVAWNDAPQTDDAAASGLEDASSIPVTLTGSDLDGTIDRFRLTTLPANGALYLDAGLTVVAATGVDYAASAESLTLFFVPSADWNGSTNFGYVAGSSDGGVDATAATASITVGAVNDLPVIDLDADDSSGVGGSDYEAQFVEGGGPVLVIDSDASLIDVDSGNLTGLTVSIGNLIDSGHEFLTADVSGTSIVAAFDSNSGVLTLSGLDSAANYEQVLRTIRYENTSDVPDGTDRQLWVRADDNSLGYSNDALVTVHVVASNDVPVGSPTISGTPTEDQTLTADVGSIADAEGLGAFSYQWSRDGVAIGGATASTYTLGDADVGANISVTVSYTDGQGTNESLTSATVGPVANVNDASTGAPIIVGTATEDQTLTADVGSVADADGLGAFSYQWLRDGVAIGGVTANTYTLGDADVGASISVTVSYTDGQGTNESLTSATVGPVTNLNDAPTGVPTISGTPTEDQTLTADVSGIADADGLGAFSYQWMRNGVAIAGATGSTYALVDLDVNANISVQVSYTDAQGTSESSVSAVLGPVAALPAVWVPLEPPSVPVLPPAPIAPPAEPEAAADEPATESTTSEDSATEEASQDEAQEQDQAADETLAGSVGNLRVRFDGVARDGQVARLMARLNGFTPANETPIHVRQVAGESLGETDFLLLLTRDFGEAGRFVPSLPSDWQAETAFADDTSDPVQRELEVLIDSVKFGGLALSVGAVWWASRLGGLVGSMLASAPAWRHMDPLPVLGKGDDEDDESWCEADDKDADANELAISLVLEGGGSVRGAEGAP